MPSKTPEQAKFMRAACHDKKIADSHHIKQETACEFVRADQAQARAQAKGQKPAREGMTISPSAAVFTTGYVHPTGQPPFKVF
jgi:hypothetical protein